MIKVKLNDGYPLESGVSTNMENKIYYLLLILKYLIFVYFQNSLLVKLAY